MFVRNMLWNAESNESGAVNVGNKLKDYIKQLRTLLDSEEPIPDADRLREELKTEIGFWQHERLIHLLVTILFAALTMAVFILLLFYTTIGVVLLLAALMALLVPYIRHYFILENGVQTLYVVYEDLIRRTSDPSVADVIVPKLPGIKL